MENKIPLTNELLTTWSSGLYYYGCINQWACNDHVVWYNPNDRQVTYYYNAAAKFKAQQATGSSGVSFNPWWNKIVAEKTIRTTGYLCMMPERVWLPFKAQIDIFPSIKTRNLYCRVFFYLYMNISAHNNLFGQSVEQMKNELVMNQSKLCEIISWLTRKGFINRSTYQFGGNSELSRQYWLPHDYWTDERLYEEEQLKNNSK